MSQHRVGIWFVGARGGVATTATLGLAALNRGLIDTTGLVTALAPFSQLDLAGWDQMIVGGHEIRTSTLVETAEGLAGRSRAVEPALVEACRDELEAADRRVRLGTLAGCGAAVERLASADVACSDDRSPRATITQIQQDLAAFVEETRVDRVVVVNLASTEPPLDVAQIPPGWAELAATLDDPARCHLPASSLYAIAALELGWAYINFTPSIGSSLPAIDELARSRGTCHAGRDGKTGETLLKTTLAPMFAARNLDVMSWVGHNIFGNMDGQVLDHPANKSAKVTSKSQVLEKILGYQPQSHVSIEFIESLGDWKTAWDHIHFRGFLGTPMTLQFTWQGCDSLLAGPLVLDLVRLVDLAQRRGETGALGFLCSFFKSPLGCQEYDFHRQVSILEDWAARAAR